MRVVTSRAVRDEPCEIHDRDVETVEEAACLSEEEWCGGLDFSSISPAVFEYGSA